jgi:RNA recognition motif-containing protein
LFVKNLRFVWTLETLIAEGLGMVYQRRILTGSSYNVTPEELFDLFGKFGPIR